MIESFTSENAPVLRKRSRWLPPYRRWHSVLALNGSVVRWTSHFTEYGAAKHSYRRRWGYRGGPRVSMPSKQQLLWTERLHSDVFMLDRVSR